MKFNIFHNGIMNTIPNGEIDVKEFIGLIKEDTHLFKQIRGEKDKDKRNLLKKKLSYVTFGGTFKSRGNANLLRSSGLAHLDIDDVKSKEELEVLRQKAISNKYSHCVFISPSGNGMKIIVKIPDVKNDEEYKLYWEALAKHYSFKEFNDKSVKDIARACYLSYDSKPYYNDFSEVFTEKKEGKEIEEVVDVDTSKDESRSGKEFGIIIKMIKKGKTKEEIFNEMNIYSKWSSSSKQYKEMTYNKALEKTEIKEKEESNYFIFEKEGQVKQFIKNQPMFYDRSDMWWIWDKPNTKWELTDKTDILNEIKKLGINTISSKDRTEIINALQQVGRENIPKEIPKGCIQFKNKIINLKTNEEFKSSSDFFSTNPLPWDVGETEETPIMDKLFEEWVGKEYVQTLYEIIAYSSCGEQFMQRMIALVGGGSNGKGTFVKLLKKFLGKSNCSSSELALLSSNQFETSMIYKKLLCEMGEVSYADLKSTNQIKKLSGEDDIRYCFKGKTPFSEESPTTCIINTNSLPDTPDKTLGFYRRWLIIDFPNQFENKVGLIEKVPDVEFENLAKKSIRILKGLYSTQKFTKEGSFQERTEKYESRSNPVMKFVEEECEEETDCYTTLKFFSKELNKYLDLKHLRKMNSKEIKKKLLDEGFEVSRTTKKYVRDIYISNLKIKIIPIIPIIPENQTSITHVNLTQNNGINGINGIITQNQPKIEVIDMNKKRILKND